MKRAAIRIQERLDSAVHLLGGDAAVAEILGVEPATLQRWREGELPNPEQRGRIIGLDAVLALLEGYLEVESVRKWLNGNNAHLDGRPVSMLRKGCTGEVIAAIEAQKSMGFA